MPIKTIFQADDSRSRYNILGQRIP